MSHWWATWAPLVAVMALLLVFSVINWIERH